jgi:hypothetical protein
MLVLLPVDSKLLPKLFLIKLIWSPKKVYAPLLALDISQV